MQIVRMLKTADLDWIAALTAAKVRKIVLKPAINGLAQILSQFFRNHDSIGRF